MFDLQGDRKKAPFTFELEKELQDPKFYRETKEKVEQRLQNIKKTLRDGEDEKGFEDFGLLLHGYESLLKVIHRSVDKKK